MTSVVNFFGENNSGSCGYCKDKNEGGKSTIGSYMHFVGCDTYEQLLARQWRRCGKYYYQPQNHSTCCPQYTIRLDCTKFVEDKKHRKVVRKIENFLQGKKKKTTKGKIVKASGPTFQFLDTFFSSVIDEMMKSGKLPKVEGFYVHSAVNKKGKSEFQVQLNVCFQLAGLLKKQKSESKPPSEICSLILDFVKNGKLPEQVVRVSGTEKGCILIQLADFNRGVMAGCFPGKKKKKPFDKSESKKQKMSIEKDKEDFDELVAELVKAKFDKESYEVYKKYQMTIHGDEEEELTEKAYEGFLIDTSLNFIAADDSDVQDRRKFKLPLNGVGTFHLRYRLKKSNKLIAVSVLDVLPNGVSSVYFFYDVDYKFLQLGKYSAIKEIEMIRDESKKLGNFKYYYMGFYIHDCQKMKYKAQYKPSELVCNETWQWVPVELCQKKLSNKRYSRFAAPERRLMRRNALETMMKLNEEANERMKLFHSSVGEVSSKMAFFVQQKDLDLEMMKNLLVEKK